MRVTYGHMRWKTWRVRESYKTQQEADPKPTAKQQTISELRQGIGWIECEIKRRKSRSHRPTVKQGMRLRNNLATSWTCKSLGAPWKRERTSSE